MDDLLLDVTIVVDICAHREPFCGPAAEAVVRCADNGGRVWLYSGSVQTLQYVLAAELARTVRRNDQPLSSAEAHGRACRLLEHFAADKQWLAALAEDGPVFGTEDPEDEQLLRALGRFPPGAAALLTRDEALLERSPDAVTPEQFLAQTPSSRPLPFVDLAAQQDTVRPDLERNLHRVLHHGRYVMGPEVAELEEKLAHYVGVRHAIGCSSGTDALLLCLMALGVGPGDAVFTTPFTFVATAEAIALLGATPVFVDIDPTTFNLDPAELARAVEALEAHDPALYPLPINHADLTPKGVLPVDLYGLPADYDPIRAICDRHGLFLVEDAAQSMGGVYKGRRAGSLGDMAATSFFPAKPLGGYGDGGMVFTDRADLAEAARSLRVHGKGATKYDNTRVGLNARLDTFQAAILLAKFEAFPHEVEARQRVAARYAQRFGPLGSVGIVPPAVPEQCRSGWAQFTVRLPADRRDAVARSLGEAGIPAAVYYPRPLHRQSAFAPPGCVEEPFREAERASREVLSLPFGPSFCDPEAVCTAMLETLEATGAP